MRMGPIALVIGSASATACADKAATPIVEESEVCDASDLTYSLGPLDTTMLCFPQQGGLARPVATHERHLVTRVHVPLRRAEQHASTHRQGQVFDVQHGSLRAGS